MHITRIGTTVAILVVSIGTSLFAQGFNHSPKPILRPRCFIKLIDEAHIAAEESGLLTKIDVEDGDRVGRGQKLAQVDDNLAKLQRNVAEAELNVAKKEAQNYISVEYAQKTAATAAREVQRHKEANARMQVISQSDVDKALLALEEAKTYIKKAEFDLEVKAEEVKVKQASLDAAKEHIARRTVKAPWPGTVERIIRHEGDWVEPGNPILHLIRMDKLRVHCLIDADDYNTYDIIGKKVRVTVYLARKQPAIFEGRITGVSPKVQAGNEFKAWADIDNREINGHWILRDGMTASMEIFADK